MPTEADYLAFQEEERAKGLDRLLVIGESLRARWPLLADREAYITWSMKRADEDLAAFFSTPVPREDMKEMIATINFNDATSRGKLVNAMQRTIVPWIPVGSDRNGEIYRMVPGAYGLLPDQLEPKIESGRELVSMNVLGVNTNVQPKIPVRRRQANLSEESSRLNESDDMETGGFVFHQLGALEYWGDEPENLTSYEGAANGDWLPTLFRVVVRFGRNGAANGIYIVYDFYPEDENGSSRYPKTDSEYWGQLPEDKSGQRVSIARIADKITDLRFGRTFDMTEVFDYPVELVRAVSTREGTIIRATISTGEGNIDSTF